MEMATRIEKFLEDTKEISQEQYEIVITLREIINAINPSAAEEIKYGGLVFNVDKTLKTGIFTYKNHVSLEFSFGAGFEDEDNHLEGKGKMRRHLKIKKLDDIDNKRVKNFVTICFE